MWKRLRHLLFGCDYVIRGWTYFANPVQQCVYCGQWTVMLGLHYWHPVSEAEAHEAIVEVVLREQPGPPKPPPNRVFRKGA